MTIYHIILFGPPVAAMLALAWLFAWALVALGKAWQNVQERR